MLSSISLSRILIGCLMVATFLLDMGNQAKSSQQLSWNALDAFDLNICGQISESLDPVITHRVKWQNTGHNKGNRNSLKKAHHSNKADKKLTGRNHKRKTTTINQSDSPNSSWNISRWDAAPGEAPWYVSLQTYFLHHYQLRYPRCAGTLIHNNIILTTAHCIERGKLVARKKSFAALGISDWQSNETVEKLAIKQVCLPNSYRSSSSIWFRNATDEAKDLGLIVLEQPVKYTDYIKPACLYDLNECHDLSSKRDCIAVGLGHQLLGHRPSKLSAVSMRTCWIGEQKPHRSDELCFVASSKQNGQLNMIDRGSGIYCRDPDSNRTYVIGMSTINIQPVETVCCKEKPQQIFYTNLFNWRDELSSLLNNCRDIN